MVHDPADLRRLAPEQLAALAGRIREFLVESVSRTGGHLGSNLAAVELTIAVHRVFDSPRDPIVWDTGHQAYVHKILTGRAGMFDSLRRLEGLSLRMPAAVGSPPVGTSEQKTPAPRRLPRTGPSAHAAGRPPRPVAAPE
jgi:hypothetical protein